MNMLGGHCHHRGSRFPELVFAWVWCYDGYDRQTREHTDGLSLVDRQTIILELQHYSIRKETLHYQGDCISPC